MGFVRAAIFALLVSLVHAAAVSKRQEKYCNTSTSVCYIEYSTTASNPIYRIAVQDKPAAPFDTLLQIIAPASLGWVGFSWGGAMTLNPLTVAWPNGNSVVVSSRWAT